MVLQWDPTFGWGEILTVFGFLATITGLIYAAREVRRNTQNQRAQFLLDLTDRYFADNDIRRFYYKIDYNKFKYIGSEFPDSDEERWLDALLYTFDVIGSLVRLKVVSENEVKIFKFQASRVMNNEEVKNYLKWLDAGELEREGIMHPAHEDARFLAGALIK